MHKQLLLVKGTDNAKAFLIKGINNGNLGNISEAIKCFQKAIKFNPHFAEAYGNLGVSYIEKKEYQLAINALKKSVQLKPDLAEAHLNLGRAYAFIKEYYFALEEYQ